MDDWKEATAPDGRTYYYNVVTKETTWTKPASKVETTEDKITRMLAAEEELNKQLQTTLNAARQHSQNPFVQNARLVFDEIDVKRTGELSVEDFYNMMKMLGHNTTLEEAKASVGKYDTDGNGKMNFFEFLDFLGF